MVTSRKPDSLPLISGIGSARICSTSHNHMASPTFTSSNSTPRIPESSGFNTTPFVWSAQTQGEISGHASRNVIPKDESGGKSLVTANLAALEEGCITPLVKEELRYTIQSRRMAEGKGELQVEFNEPQSTQLTDEEKSRVIKRREQNRDAARRFRSRQKKTAHDLLKETQRLESANTLLRAEMRQLSKERSVLQTELNQHLRVCSKVITYNPTKQYIPT